MRNTSAIAIAAACLLALATPAFADVNLIPNLPTGWSWPLVPRPASDATLTSVPLPLTLTGDASSTWLNSAWRNLGSTSSMAFHNYALLDGAQIIVDRSCNPLAAGAVAQGINGGPYTLPAGRHTFELRVDATNVVTESVETDNNVARQWVWAPANLAAGPRVTRTAPPDPTGGWSSIPANQAKYNNCDGLRFTTSTSWDAVYTWSNDAAVDYDLHYYTPSTGASDGFSSPLGNSMRDGRGVEAVFTKGFGMAQRSYDIGVERWAGAGTYHAQHVTAQYISVGDSITFSFQAEEMLKIFYLAPLFPLPVQRLAADDARAERRHGLDLRHRSRGRPFGTRQHDGHRRDGTRPPRRRCDDGRRPVHRRLPRPRLGHRLAQLRTEDRLRAGRPRAVRASRLALAAGARQRRRDRRRAHGAARYAEGHRRRSALQRGDAQLGRCRRRRRHRDPGHDGWPHRSHVGRLSAGRPRGTGAVSVRLHLADPRRTAHPGHGSEPRVDPGRIDTRQQPLRRTVLLGPALGGLDDVPGAAPVPAAPVRRLGPDRRRQRRSAVAELRRLAPAHGALDRLVAGLRGETLFLELPAARDQPA
ncbi:MAG: hypothetical protein IPJ24_10830 [bacterium]|nr:hypothetical protein [bacterium]